ncbi:P-loop containing nucleoside triphosphate hydrolase protein [Polychytrium aggregatum]|uniref:P-loop containing nucleoside triphosphate hydrolase protein n=1 Tax=Polychytrium aggregatum TaxID=110093 RepID=UPI0022FE8FDB|nr:P-loop containing nucleoside triphosphate hydrolase protein [Polychytrium aggregatum]KAI9202023.1 P-loop containing nucleoside triphosphate hydrolase protein [Polychytrium aggregatum]
MLPPAVGVCRFIYSTALRPSLRPISSTPKRSGPSPPQLERRPFFEYQHSINWFPGHQNKALRQLEKGLTHIDLVLEVRDARIPFSSTNPQFDQVLGARDRIIVFNKTDLANPRTKQNIIAAFKKWSPSSNLLFTCAHQDRDIKAIIRIALDKVKMWPERYPYLTMVVVGLPNVGKSTLINALRRIGVHKGKATQVGPYAGVTQAIQTRIKIHEDPNVYLIDTPGIFSPKIVNPIQGLRIALTGATKDRLTEEQHVADYLLFRLNWGSSQDRYVYALGLPGPTDDINIVLNHIARTRRLLIDTRPQNLSLMVNASNGPIEKVDRPAPRIGWERDYLAWTASDSMRYDHTRAAQYMIRLFREGQLGRLTLDECDLEAIDQWFNSEASNRVYKDIVHDRDQKYARESREKARE